MLKLKTRRERFSAIYDNKLWLSDESLSGGGSDEYHTTQIRSELPKLIRAHNIKSVVDAGCGDFNWLRLIRKKLDIEYTGLDIVESVIINNKKYQDARTQFHVADVISDPIPDCDLLIVRDVLFHLSFHDIEKFLFNLKDTNYRYLLTTSHVFSREHKNTDIETGDFRKIDLEARPFFFNFLKATDQFEDHPDGFVHPRRLGLFEKSAVPLALSESR
ncbi:class I SAM-dependent methyltransferase [Sphingomonadaceae bacterium]|nr:class I SAM-dependent methyltransferase [Sphingomonadaceae bacterium]